jgi:MFS family permease
MLKGARSRLHYGWAIFVLSLGNLTVEGGTKNSEAVYFNALLVHFQRSATYTAAVFSAAGLVGALAAPFLGVLLDRWGARVLFPLAGFCILFGWFASSFATDLWQLFFFYSIFAGIGQTAISSFSMTATLAPWFPNSRGRMLGLADSGNPIGQAIFAPLAAILTESIGWRWAYRYFGFIFFALITFPNGLFQRRPPATASVSTASAAAPTAVATPTDAQPAPSSPTASQTRTRVAPPPMSGIVTQPAMWLLVLTRVTGSIGVQLVRVHLVTFFVLAGYTPLIAASTMGAVGGVSVFARPLVGIASDRWGRELVFTVGTLLTVISIVLIVWLGDGSFWPLVVYVALAGISDGISGLIVGAKAADLFPPEALGTIMGFIEMGRGAAIFLGPLLGGLMFDWQDNYMGAFLVSAGLSFASICTVWAAQMVGTRGKTRLARLTPHP